ncbi:EndoU domain-containing protein [Pseudomonas syringae pv. actinidiae]|uniref:Large exoprotein involved in heme utilization or adhesion n=1 Tax=Pseudomonas syringae pv. actinidiae TaxID=103796 RepID=A0AAN4TMX7_PSESF|nr:EndoU domain-containing protein [Pseudomonas syringae]EPN66585.1 hypothetical protein A235_11058 [Pseudomonas syringae pv. actinidiae ICMP 19079]EPN69257.1 hypothetical protein A234_24750 [Pseudomonas syringae pv. actinidiae ICMP 19101]AKT31826.1 hypothetical protein IYO_020350 [Pseudomonas syringae pv. actinidiae ICMP 18884]AOE58191.1 hypothetical protein NZ708_20330 [Pseudomonas syringae pv. actinidiae ICMP 18708]APP99143.1 hypothetical protein PsaNZ45_20880 [Pseudomonas syringae pv. acti
MFFFHMLPSWDSIRRQLDRDIAPYRGGHFRTHRNEPVPSPALIMRRFNCVRSAFDRAEWEACRILGQRFVDLDISSIIKDLIDVVTQMAMIVVGSAFVGGAAGAGAGVLFFGVGAVPGGLIGAALGAQASAFILGILGLEAIAESVIDGFPRIIEYYTRGITTAWQGPREQGRNPFMGDDLAAQNSAVQEIAQGHVEVVILLLGAMVQYITRGRGNARALANEMRASAKGERLGQWMLEHEDELKKRPDLQRPEPRRGALEAQESASHPAPKSPQPDPPNPKIISDNPSLVDKKAEKHILDGDGPASGGHRFGTGVPGKSEFPKSWSDEKILSTISDIATDPKTQWSSPDGRGYQTGSGNRDGINIKVVYDKVKGRVVTGYPTNTPKNPKL